MGLPMILSLISPVSSCPAVSGFIGNISVVVSFDSCFVIRVVKIDVVNNDDTVNIVVGGDVDVNFVDDDDTVSLVVVVSGGGCGGGDGGGGVDVVNDGTVNIVVDGVVEVDVLVVGAAVGGCGGSVSML